MTRTDLVSRGTLALGLAILFALGTWAAWGFVIDDAFITFRYSANLAEGHGPVWNVGDDPVEGFTNFAWMLLLAPFSALGLDLVVVAKVISLITGVAVLAMLLHYAIRHAAPASGMTTAVVSGAAFTVFLPTYFHLNAGLETVAFAAIVLRAAIIGLHVVNGRPVRFWEPPLLFLLAGMLRPEGVVAVLPAVGLWFWRERKQQRALFCTGLAAAAGIGYFIWRWSFYGHLLPNTFYVKFGNLTAGAEWVEQTVTMFGPLMLLTAALVVQRATRRAGLLLVVTVAATYATYALSGPTMDYVHRFAFHAFPVLCLGAGLAVGSLRLERRWIAASAGVGIVAWSAIAGIVPPDLPLIVNYGEDLRRAHIAIGEGLQQAEVPDHHRTVAVSDAGAIPYYSQWDAIDYIGLNDEAIAHGADPTAVVQTARPTVIVVTSGGPHVPETPYGLRIPEVTAGYALTARVQMREGYWQNVFVLPEWAPEVGSTVRARVSEAQRTHDPGRYELTFDRWLDRLRDRI